GWPRAEVCSAPHPRRRVTDHTPGLPQAHVRWSRRKEPPMSELPVPQPDAEHVNPPADWHVPAPGLRASARRSPPRPRVLLIEPDAQLRDVLAVALRGRGLRVSAVGTVAEARVWAAAQGPQAVVVDTDAVSLAATALAIQAAVGPRPLVLVTGAR